MCWALRDDSLIGAVEIRVTGDQARECVTEIVFKSSQA